MFISFSRANHSRYTHLGAGIKNNTRGTLSLTCGDWWVFADYPTGIKNNTRAVLAVCGVRLGS